MVEIFSGSHKTLKVAKIYDLCVVGRFFCSSREELTEPNGQLQLRVIPSFKSHNLKGFYSANCPGVTQKLAQVFLKGSFWSAWQSSSDRRMLTKRLKLILWSFFTKQLLLNTIWRREKIIIIRHWETFDSLLNVFLCTMRGLAAVRAAPVSYG